MELNEIYHQFPNNFKGLTGENGLYKVRLITQILSGKFREQSGIDESSPVFRVYHATVSSRLKNIAQDGLKAFFEHEKQQPRIFVTASPTIALWHVIENGPHDTLRKKGILNSDISGDPVLLMLELDKQWLATQPDIQKPLDRMEYIRLLAYDDQIDIPNRQGISRIDAFREIVKAEVGEMQKGNEASELGIPLPVDWIPPKSIYIDKLNEFVPLTLTK